MIIINQKIKLVYINMYLRGEIHVFEINSAFLFRVFFNMRGRYPAALTAFGVASFRLLNAIVTNITGLSYNCS